MGETDRVELAETWDDMENAAQRVLTALPAQMTEAAERLDRERQRMRKLVQKILLQSGNKERSHG